MMQDIDKDITEIRKLMESQPARSWRPRDMAAKLGYRGGRARVLHAALENMMRDGTIMQIRPGVFNLGKDLDLITGKLELVRSGAGYVTDNTTGESVRIDSGDVGTALPGDIVTARKAHDESRAHSGSVIRIAERGGREIVGTLSTTGRLLHVIPFDPIYRRNIVVPDARGATGGDRVVVRLLSWDDPHDAPEGEVVDVIGPSDRPSLDTEVVVRQFRLPGDFPDAVMREAEQISEQLKQPGKRLDLRRDTLIVTIDPATARDFDDALSMTRDDQNRRVLGVHIADVSHFVQPGSPLDVEAASRTTSVYLVDKVIPMLPEQLSNGVCSLRPDEDRLCFSAFLTFDDSGLVVARRFAKTTIRSRLRLTYEQALAVIEKRKPEGIHIPVNVVELILATHELAQQLRRARMQKGALDIDVPECEVLMGEDARMTGIKTRPNDVSHQMIEECMVAANEAVATELKSQGIPILSRLHEPPDPLKIEELTAALQQLGFRPGDLTDPRNLTRFLAVTVGHPLRDNAHLLVLRSMKRAIYSAEEAGHFGLAKRYYSHFTSPIRRYPDLVLHRQLAGYLARPRRAAADIGYLKATAAVCTENEQRADDAARALIEIKKYRFLQQQLDDGRPETYDAVISQVTNFGLFVDLTDLQLGGLIHISTIAEEFVRYNASNRSLSAAGRQYRLGDKVRVVVVRVDFDNRHADFVLVHDETSNRQKKGGSARRLHEAKPSGQEQPRQRHKSRQESRSQKNQKENPNHKDHEGRKVKKEKKERHQA